VEATTLNPQDSLWLLAIKFNSDGLIAAIAQDAVSHEVLMLAWMNAEALTQTLLTGDAHYWSRSRKALWHKGESSSNLQRVKEMRLDCDGDALIMQIEQVGGSACHTGRRRCFYRRLENGAWVVTEPVISTPTAH
jgi:phosphoribosyl-AMP cyclohydrolase